MKAIEMEKNYIDWLKDNEIYKDLKNDVVRIDTPFLDESLDNIIIYAESLKNNAIKLSDGGWTMDYLETHGFTFRKGSNRYNLLHSTLNNYGLELDKNESITVKCNASNFPIAKQRITQGLIKINDLIVLNDKNVVNTFKDDLLNVLTANKILYDEPYTITGKNGYTYTFDFSVPSLGGKKKLVNAITQPNKINNAKLFMVDANLSSEIDPKASFFAVLNDKDKIHNLDEIRDLFLKKSRVRIEPILMSETKKITELLSNKAA